MIGPGLTRTVTWAISGVTLVAVASRAAGLPEALWAAVGAATLVIIGAVSFSDALQAVSRGTDVYLFLVGMMMLAELLRRHGVFDWLAMHALEAARGSPLRLLGVIYLVGVVVTAVLSNDATAVVLAPAVAVAVGRTNARPLPYLYACAFVANAASFLLPISNPANLVVYADRLPPLWAWLRAFGLASLFAVLVTYAALILVMRGSLRERVHDDSEPVGLTAAGRLALAAVSLSGLVMIVAALFTVPLGRVTISVAVLSLAIVSAAVPRTFASVLRRVAWSIVPLVAALFTVVAALDRAGLPDLLRTALSALGGLPGPLGAEALSASVTVACAVANNLTVALLAEGTRTAGDLTPLLVHRALTAVDLGPNLAVSGSLATLLWLRALRHEGIVVTPLQFARIGVCVLTPALAGAALLVH
ncbi:MAG TPA: SLC13 family permease [Candidatus Acidoferrales bacterium]|nr:SLC13 family permease [Candidatus Acidoferrales bacterium]